MLDLSKKDDAYLELKLRSWRLTPRDLLRLRQIQVNCYKEVMANHRSAKRAIYDAIEESGKGHQGNEGFDEQREDEPPPTNDRNQFAIETDRNVEIYGAKPPPRTRGRWNLDIDAMGQAIKESLPPFFQPGFLGGGGGGRGRIPRLRPI